MASSMWQPMQMAALPFGDQMVCHHCFQTLCPSMNEMKALQNSVRAQLCWPFKKKGLL